MKILSVNAGSATVKFQLYEMPEKKVLVAATFERIGIDRSFYRMTFNGEKIQKDAVLSNHEEAVKIFLQELVNLKIVNSLEELEGIGHRVVQGADRYSGSVIVTDEVIKDIDELSALAPLHNPAHLLAINITRKMLPNSKNVVVFDTAFHQTMKSDAYIYPVPYDWYKEYGIRRYGFHGTSHKYLSQRVHEILGRKDLKIITCHLGSGASICAIEDGKCVETSMGFTPMAGIPMCTRCGDIDPSIISYIMKKTNKTVEEITNDLNKNSGLLGVSGVSADNRDIQEGINKGDERCILARNIFIRRVSSFIASYIMMLKGVDVVVFSAGIGENSPEVREAIMNNFDYLGVTINKENNIINRKEVLISGEDSKIRFYVIPTDEELMIAEETYELIER
jgi:acetate kinase